MSEYKIKVTTRAQGKNDTQYFSRHEIEGYSLSVQARLKKAKHNHAALFCCCKTPPIPMHIKNRKGRYALCRNPKTGKEHAPLCDSYAEPHELSGRDGYSEKAVKIVDEKMIISPDFSLGINKRSAALTLAERLEQPGRKRNTVTLLGVLQLIYDTARFNTWHPKMKGKRKYNIFAYYMAKALADIQFTRGRAMLDTTVVITSDINVKSAIKHVCYAGKQQPKRRCIVLGRIMQVKKASNFEGKQTYALHHISDSDFTPFYMSEAQWLNCQRSYITSNVTGDDFKPDTSQFYIVISVVSMNKNDSIIIEQCAVMPVTRDFIPYDSSYEKTVADALVEQDRAFSKPLRYDSAEIIFPDFMLNDMSMPVPMEVYGMVNNVDYTRRKQDKNLYYKIHYPHFWSWDLAVMPTIPAFPLKETQ